MRLPDFGYEFECLSEYERQRVQQIAGIQPEEGTLEKFFIFRTQNNLTIYLPGEKQGRQIQENKVDFLPRIFDIKANIALPDTVPIARIIEQTEYKNKLSGKTTTLLEQWQRKHIDDALDDLAKHKIIPKTNIDPGFRTINGQPRPISEPSEHQFITNQECQLLDRLTKYLNLDDLSNERHQQRNEEFNLAYKLICEIAKVDVDVLFDLIKNSLEVGKEGYMGAIIDRINKNLEESLNFPNWWVQDRAFRLVVSMNNYHLRFAIRDRTGTTYSFSERSSGLKYFLSYYIQYKAHNPNNKVPEILLMDEPDAYLSSQAQQDLLRIFEAFAQGQDGRKPVQVVYVTHSPFLIDKNHPDRIRVVEKGVEDEGTRLVKDVDKNHYEPLRSAFGAFVGETTFIGNCNLMVEGLAEQILLAGAATYLRYKDVSELETLNLNHITIIPTEGAVHIPYLTYLARGQGVESPAVVLIMDSDQEGNDAKKKLQNSKLIDDKFILQIGELTSELNLSKCCKIEDLIPLSICVTAARRYAETICKAQKEVLEAISETAIKDKLKTEQTFFKAIEAYFQDVEGLYIEDVGFARMVLETVYELSKCKETPTEVNEFEARFKFFFRKINEKQRQANEELKKERISNKIGRLVNSFLISYKTKAARWEVSDLFNRIEDILDTSKESKEAQFVIQKIRQDYELEEDMRKDVDRYDQFKQEIEKIPYAGRLASQKNVSQLVVDNYDSPPHSVSNSTLLSNSNDKPPAKPKNKGFAH